MTEDLLPCPFCGEYPDKSCVIGEYNESGLYIRLQCPNADKECLACGPWVLYLGDSTDEEDMFKQASEAWNTRHCTVLYETSKDPVCLQIIPTEALKAELNRRDEYNESGELPEWLKEAIELGIKYAIINADANQNKPVLHAKFFALRESLEWVLSLRKPELNK